MLGAACQALQFNSCILLSGRCCCCCCCMFIAPGTPKLQLLTDVNATPLDLICPFGTLCQQQFPTVQIGHSISVCNDNKMSSLCTVSEQRGFTGQRELLTYKFLCTLLKEAAATHGEHAAKHMREQATCLQPGQAHQPCMRRNWPVHCVRLCQCNERVLPDACIGSECQYRMTSISVPG
jgi:hypothetical protein